MEDYVVPDFYDVMVGAIAVPGSGEGEDNEVDLIAGSFSWDSKNGVTGVGTTVTHLYTGDVLLTIEPNDTKESIAAKINNLENVSDYNSFDFYTSISNKKSSFYGCYNG